MKCPYSIVFKSYNIDSAPTNMSRRHRHLARRYEVARGEQKKLLKYSKPVFLQNKNNLRHKSERRSRSEQKQAVIVGEYCVKWSLFELLSEDTSFVGITELLETWMVGHDQFPFLSSPPSSTASESITAAPDYHWGLSCPLTLLSLDSPVIHLANLESRHHFLT